MNLAFRKITRKNYEDICDLVVAEDQRGHLSSNMESILDSKFDKDLVPRAIYLDDKPVGFIMVEKTPKDTIEIFRFMIDQRYQNKGYGRAALELAIAKFEQLEGIRKIQICYHPDNDVAKGLYQKLGFKEIGMDESGEDMLAIRHVDMQDALH